MNRRSSRVAPALIETDESLTGEMLSFGFIYGADDLEPHSQRVVRHAILTCRNWCLRSNCVDMEHPAGCLHETVSAQVLSHSVPVVTTSVPGGSCRD